MRTIQFITMDQKHAYVWCTTNTIEGFRNFLQYMLDNFVHPEKFILLDTESGLLYNAYRIATEQYQMRKRTFQERMDNIQTGKWASVAEERLSQKITLTEEMEDLICA